MLSTASVIDDGVTAATGSDSASTGVDSNQLQHPYEHRGCVHCGLPVPQHTTDTTDRFCCHGCEIAYAILQEDADLQAVWESRKTQQADQSYEAMDHDVFRDRYVEPVGPSQCAVELAIENLVCASCLFAIEKLPHFLPGVLTARVNLTTSRVRLTWNPQQIPLSEIARTLDRLGYPPHPVDDDSVEAADRQENRRRLIQLSVAGVCAGNAMLIAFAMYHGLFTGIAPEFATLFRVVSALLGLLSLAWPGRGFFVNAWRSVRTGTPHMDVPVAVGLSAGMLLGVTNTLLGRGEVYFDSLTVLVFFLLVGRYLQYHQQRRAIRQVSLLHALTPRSVRRILRSGPDTSPSTQDERIEIVPLEAVQVGDRLEIRSGDLVPADGRIVTGQSTIDSSILTGETAGRPVHPGMEIVAGTTNLHSPLVMEVDKVAGDTRLAEITRLVETGLATKTPTLQFANAIASRFVAVVLTLSAVTLLLWLPTDWELAINHAMALLIVACPCALGLATPFSIAIAQARAARRQILIKSGDVLEKLQHPGQLWLDKTGTVTLGHPKLLKWTGDRDCMTAVVAIESQIVHPLATTLVNELKPLVGQRTAVTAVDVTACPGLGVRGRVGPDEFAIGAARWADEAGFHWSNELSAAAADLDQRGLTTLMIARNGNVVAVAALGDQIRDDAVETVYQMQQNGWQVGLLSGDAPATVQRIAAEIGLRADQAHGHVSPEAKLAKIQSSSPQTTTVMVGDGVNDSAALAASSVGIAVHGGAAVSLQAADVYLARPGLAPILELFAGSRQTVRTIRLNFVASLGYNLGAAGLAMAGLINPLIAAVLMPLSSLTVLTIACLNPAFRGRDR